MVASEISSVVPSVYRKKDGMALRCVDGTFVYLSRLDVFMLTIGMTDEFQLNDKYRKDVKALKDKRKARNQDQDQQGRKHEDHSYTVQGSHDT